ncbi:MAG: hypothetical protein U0930_04855 [Pirellulales bacterium]
MSEADRIKLKEAEAALLKLAKAVGVDNLTYDELADYIIARLKK